MSDPLLLGDGGRAFPDNVKANIIPGTPQKPHRLGNVLRRGLRTVLQQTQTTEVPQRERAMLTRVRLTRELNALDVAGLGAAEVSDGFLDRPQRDRRVEAFPVVVQLSQLRDESSLASVLANHLEQRAWTVANTKLNVCPYIDLRGHTWPSYLTTLGPNIRKNINRYLRNLPKNFDLRVDCVQAPAEVLRALDVAIELHKKRWDTTGLSEAFNSASVISFHREFAQLAARQGWLRLLILWLDGTAAASLYGLRYGPTFYFYQSGFDPVYSKHSVGVATMGLAIKTAIEEGASEYDFLHGNEEYKFHWAQKVRDLNRLELHPPQAIARIYKQAIILNRAARQMARRVLNRARANAALNR